MSELSKDSLYMAMDMTAAMAAESYAQRTGESVENVLLDLLGSRTADMLYDSETSLWANGPEYVADEFANEMSAKG
ncbi:hypothetical protein [Selenomonas ruminantium]|uniref:hypothetical protein n=1 Tax=Selenomonas ruminantium TaxID=971 RepID=UPI0026EA60D1|nr:hypothetical protein [Selenomonas ruminantium]